MNPGSSNSTHSLFKSSPSAHSLILQLQLDKTDLTENFGLNSELKGESGFLFLFILFIYLLIFLFFFLENNSDMSSFSFCCRFLWSLDLWAPNFNLSAFIPGDYRVWGCPSSSQREREAEFSRRCGPWSRCLYVASACFPSSSCRLCRPGSVPTPAGKTGTGPPLLTLKALFKRGKEKPLLIGCRQTLTHYIHLSVSRDLWPREPA